LNNLGQENTNVRAAQSPAEFEFTLRNGTRLVRRYRFEVDAYQIPPLQRCDEPKTDAGAVLRRHERGSHPIPAGFSVQIDPPEAMLDPGASVKVTVSVEPPAGFIGRQPVNINAFNEQGFAGGVTLITEKGI
jgi:hypothetical protein